MKPAQFIFTHISRIPQIIFQLPNNTIFAWKKLSAKNRYILLVAVFASFLILIPIALSTLFNSDKAEAAWWNDSWGYRQSIVLKNDSSYDSLTTPYRLIIDTASLISSGKMNSNGGDLRVVNDQGKIVKFQIEQSTLNTTTTGIWFEANVEANSSAIYYLYYGNSQATMLNFQSDVLSVTGNGTTVEMKDGFGYSTNNAYARVSDIRKNGTNLRTNGNYHYTSGYPGNWWDDRAFTQELLASGPLFVEVKMSDSNYGSYSSFGTNIKMFKNGYAEVRVFMTYNTSGSDYLYYYLHFDTDIRNSVWVNGSGTLIDQAPNSGNLYQADLKESWFGQRWTATGNYGGTIVRKNNSDFNYGGTSAQASYYQTNYSISQAYANGDSREIRYGIFAGDGGLSEMQQKGGLYGAYSTTLGSEEKSQGPVAYWKFDEGTGTTTKDSSSKGHNASLVSGTTWTAESECISGKCLKFDGVDDYVAMGTGSNYFPMDTFSLCAWIKTPGLASGMSTNGIISLTYGLVMWLDSNGHLVSMLDNGTSAPTITETTVNLADNKWHYVCTSYNSTNQYLYIDGLQKTSAARTWLGTTRWPTNGANVGHNNNNPPVTKFNGFIDEVKIYNYARSEAQIKADYNARGSVAGVSTQIANDLIRQGSLANGLVGYWKQDEATWSGTLSEVVDSSGNGNHGTAAGATDAKAYPTSGKFGNGGYFDGVDDYISTSYSIVSNQTTTLAAWVKTSDLSSSRMSILNFYGSRGTLLVNAGVPTCRSWKTAGESMVAHSSSLTSNSWAHLACVFDYEKNKTTIYVNGKESTSANSFPEYLSNAVLIGDDISSISNPFPGQIDEARIYNRALSPAEIQKLYSYAPGPITEWNFEEKQGTTANDTSGNGNTGTLTNSPIWTQGKYGGGLNFQTNKFVSFSALPALSAPYTVEMWIRPKNLSTFPMTMLSLRGSNSYPKFAFWSNGKLLAYSGSEKYKYGTKTFGASDVNKWWHITFVVDSASDLTNWKIYVNGLDDTGASGANTGTYYEPSSSGTIGNDNTSYQFNGDIDEVKIYNYARTPGQIVEDMNAGHPIGGSPVGSQLLHLKLDEGYGSISKSQVNEHTFDHFNSPTWISDGKFGKAIDFDGLNDHLRAGSSDPFEYRGGDYTISTWFYPHSGDTDGGWMISKPWNGSGQYNYTIKHNSDKTITLGLVGATSWSGTTTKTININSWHHIAVTIENSTKSVKIYFDGILTYSGTHTITDWTPSSGDTNVRLSIGCLYPYGTWAGNTTHCVKGKIDEVKIYNATLTADQIKLDYNQGKSMVLGSFGTDSDGITASNSASRIYCIPGDTSTCNPPVAEWNFEEGQGGSVNDISGNGNTGTWNGSGNHWSSGKAGKAGKFDGSTDYTLCGTGSSLDMSGDFTLESWVMKKGTMTGGFGGIVTKQVSGGNGYGLVVDNSNRLAIITFSSGAYAFTIANSAMVSNAWYHVVGVRQSGTNYLYINGVKQTDQDTIAFTNATGTNCSHGRFYSGTNNYYFNGLIDQTRVYDYARTPAQIAWDYNQGKPIGHWKMDECQGLTVFDASENGNNGTITIGGTGTQTSAGTCQTSGTAWYNGATGKFNSSLNFDGADDWVNFGSSSSLNTPNDYSISLWTYNQGGSKSYPTLLNRANQSVANGFFWIYTTGTNESDLNFQFANGSSYITETFTSALGLNTWNHIVFTFNDSTKSLKLFVDGKQFSTTRTLTSSLPVNDGTLYIGTYAGNPASYPFLGKIDDVRIYNYALTPYQIRNVMNQGAGVRWGPVTGAP